MYRWTPSELKKLTADELIFWSKAAKEYAEGRY